jgi:hypothetical protein
MKERNTRVRQTLEGKETQGEGGRERMMVKNENE